MSASTDKLAAAVAKARERREPLCKAVGDAEEAYYADESDAQWKRVVDARNALARCELSIRNAEKRLADAEKAERDAETAKQRAEFDVLVKATSPEGYRATVAAEAPKIAAAVRTILEAADVIAGAMNDHQTAIRHAHDVAHDLGDVVDSKRLPSPNIRAVYDVMRDINTATEAAFAETAPKMQHLMGELRAKVFLDAVSPHWAIATFRPPSSGSYGDRVVAPATPKRGIARLVQSPSGREYLAVGADDADEAAAG